MKKEPTSMPPRYGPPLTPKERDCMHKINLIELQDILASQVGVLNRIAASGKWTPELRALAHRVLGITKQEYWEVENDINDLRRI